MLTKIQKRCVFQGMLAIFLVLSGLSGDLLKAEPVDRKASPTEKQKNTQEINIPGKRSSGGLNSAALLSAETEGKSQVSDVLPNIPLTNDLLYQIVSADIAEQRGLDIYAYETMLETAKETGDPRLAKRAAEIAVKSRNIKDALRAVRLWYRLAPQSDEAERYLVGFLVLDNRLGEVKDIYASKLSAASREQRIALFYQFQQILAGTKNKSDAFAVMEEIVAPYQDMPEAHMALAISALLKNDSVRAREEAQKALALKPDSEMAVLAFAQASSNPATAAEVLSDFLKKYPDSREVRISFARLLVGQKKYKQAKQEFLKLLSSDAHDLMALYSLGLLSVQQNDYQAAEKYLRSYLNAASVQKKERAEPTQVLFLLSQIAEEQQHYEQALQWLSQINLEDGDEVALGVEIRKAQIYARKGNIDRARKIIADMENKNPYERERLLLTEAQILREAKRTKEALIVLKSGMTEFPQSTNVLYDYALTAENLGQYDEMEKSLQRIIELDPANQQAYNALGYSLADRNIRLNEAFALIEKAMQLAPDDPFIIDSLGWVLYRQGKLDLAEQHLRRAYSLRPDNEIAIHLAEVLWIKGEQQEARSLLLQVKKKDPENELLDSTLQRLKIGL